MKIDFVSNLSFLISILYFILKFKSLWLFKVVIFSLFELYYFFCVNGRLLEIVIKFKFL